MKIWTLAEVARFGEDRTRYLAEITKIKMGM